MSDCSLLQLLADNGGTMPWVDLMNASGDPNAAEASLQSLKARGYISGDLRAYTTVRITSSGRKKLNELISVKKKKEEREDQVRKDREQTHRESRIGLVIEAVTAVAAIATVVAGFAALIAR